MLIGYNNDVQYRGKVFHIQTEDRGSPSMQIETQIFHAGAILDTRIVSYEELISGEEDKETRNKSIKSLMQKTHKELYKNLFNGGYDHFVGLEPRAQEGSEEVDEVEDFMPSQERVPDAVRALEEGGEIAEELQQAAGGDHIDLQSLKSKLARMSSASEVSSAASSSDEDATAPPQNTRNTDSSGVLKPVLSLSKKASKSAAPMVKASSLINKIAPESVASWGSTGVQAWQGCEPPREDLSVLALVEKLL